VLLEPNCASRNDKSLVAPDVGREFVAAMAEHDKVRARKRPLKQSQSFSLRREAGMSPSGPAILSSSETRGGDGRCRAARSCSIYS
jgi:hypothetical protein